MKAIWYGAIALAIVAAACSGDSSDDDPDSRTSTADGANTTPAVRIGQSDPMGEFPKCSEWLERAVTLAELEHGCVDGTTWYGSAPRECRDGRQLYWNDLGWGYAGEPMVAHAAGAERVAPLSAREACQ